MARLPRFVLPGHPQHVIIRGNNRDPVFIADEDYRYFLEKLSDGAKRHQRARKGSCITTFSLQIFGQHDAQSHNAP
ncbi:hypothetical protein [Methylophilus aquaticus]|uniref:Transposase n=1 Tax=Methylophilus aquaticus TaxID=1971610 RepID=A0ABT9JVK1_9PROT|nr:hypothetical protein [Methylophilus aquaticus]MDP8568617.1 hypothetical protein [Methylophilus aquaticus]